MQNPSEKYCWAMCTSCFRCSNKGSRAACTTCSGRHDPDLKRDPYDIDDACRCKEGVLQYRLQNGRMIIRQFHHNPFEGSVTKAAQSQDERDYQAYLQASREKRNDPNWDPISFHDGSSVDKWLKAHEEGKS